MKTRKQLEVECAELVYTEQSLRVGIAEHRRKIAELEEKIERTRESRQRVCLEYSKAE